MMSTPRCAKPWRWSCVSRGLSQAEIGLRLGVKQSRVSQMIKEALHERPVLGVDTLRQLEDARIDALQSEMWTHAQRGNVGAAGVVARLFDRRAAMLGLDEPKNTDGFGPRQFVTVAVGLEQNVIDSHREQEAIEAAVDGAVSAMMDPLAEAPQLLVRVYGVTIDAV